MWHLDFLHFFCWTATDGDPVNLVAWKHVGSNGNRVQIVQSEHATLYVTVMHILKSRWDGAHTHYWHLQPFYFSLHAWIKPVTLRHHVPPLENIFGHLKSPAEILEIQ